MIRRVIRVLFALVIITILFCAFNMSVWNGAELGAQNTNGPDVIRISKKKINALKEKRDEIENKMKKELEEAKSKLPPSDAGKNYNPHITLLENQMTNEIKNMDVLIQAADKYLTKAEKATNPQEREGASKSFNDVMNELQNNVDYYYGKKGIIWHPLHLERLENILKAAQGHNDVSAGSNLNKAWEGEFGKDMGGGVFINETAKIPLNRNNISKAEYDLESGRFILYQGSKKIFLPPMDADMTATIIKCLYYGEKGRQDISESFNIDPVTLARVQGKTYIGPYDNRYAVLFGSKNLWDTKVGKILIDSDHLLVCIMYGKNLLGREIMNGYGFPSLYHLMLDHPVMIEAFKGTKKTRRTYDTRVWITPNEISLKLSGNNLEFEDVSFRLFTETIRFTSEQYFKGDLIPNPGADVFRHYFNNHFNKFSGLIWKTDEKTGNPVKPFEELKEVAKIVGIVRWIKGIDNKSAIPMNTSWVKTFPIKNFLTPSSVDDFSMTLDGMENRIQPPIKIYNQYGISRAIDEAGRVDKYEYYESGQLKRKTRLENNRETVIWEAEEEKPASPARIVPQSNAMKIVVIGVAVLAVLFIFRKINKRREQK